MNNHNIKKPRALTFDVFGTVVDWRTSISREIQELGTNKGFFIDWSAFADEWRAGYAPSMDRVRNGQLPWMNIDSLHMIILRDLLEKYEITCLTEEEIKHLNHAWHRLDPWDDSVEGLTLLKRNFVISTLSNGNVALLVNLAKYGALPWDVILSAELTNHYKPDPEVYLSCSDYLGIPIEQIMMVAAHKNDLRAAKSQGMSTAYVLRPLEHGTATSDDRPEEFIDLIVSDFIDLNDKLTTFTDS